jgi:hypothetical protein
MNKDVLIALIPRLFDSGEMPKLPLFYKRLSQIMINLNNVMCLPAIPRLRIKPPPLCEQLRKLISTLADPIVPEPGPKSTPGTTRVPQIMNGYLYRYFPEVSIHTGTKSDVYPDR